MLAVLAAAALAQAALAAERPAGNRGLIAFSRCRPDSCPGTDIWVIRQDGSGLRLLTSIFTGHNASPSWSPDGKRIVFVSGAPGIDQIWTMRADGHRLRRLTHGPGDDAQPAWSPDGRRIAFTR